MIKANRIILTKNWPGRIFEYQELPSTNTFLLERLRESLYVPNREDRIQEWDVVWAHYQKAGRGRRGRKWITPSPKEGKTLTFSMILTVPIRRKNNKNNKKNKKLFPKWKEIGSLPQIVAWSWSEIFREAGVVTHLKWPNDILCQGKKIAGILTESITDDRYIYLVVGIGLNLVLPPDFTNQVGQPITSLSQCLPSKNNQSLLNPKTTLKFFLEKFKPLLDLWQQEGFSPFVDSWKEKSDLIGREVILYTDEKSENVTVENIDGYGFLIVREKTGRKKAITFEEISY